MLAELISNSARENYYVNTMDLSRHDITTRREGEIRDISGHGVLDAIKRGSIWILLLNPEQANPRYGELVREIYDEIADTVPGFKTDLSKMSILVSSPNIQVYYHCDVPGQTLWQVRGNKNVYVYPNEPPYLRQPDLEKIVLNEAHEISLPYDPAFDDAATVFDLQPGQMLHWPLNCPHRIVNGDCVNVSFTTEHFTPDVRRSFVVNYANGILRRELGWDQLSQTTQGLSYWAKYGVAGAYKLTGRQRVRRQSFKVDFKVDPTAPRGIADIPSYEFRK